MIGVAPTQFPQEGRQQFVDLLGAQFFQKKRVFLGVTLFHKSGGKKSSDEMGNNPS